jgi:1A family penicillin-binding protein
MENDQETQRPNERLFYEPPTVPVLPEDLQEIPGDEPGIPAPPSGGSGMRRRKNGRRGRWGCIRTGLSIAGMAIGLILAIGLIFGIVVYNSLAGEIQQDLTKLDSLQGAETFQTTRIYDRDGHLLYQIIDQGRRTEVTLDRIPLAARCATIATEDDSFYTNVGFDPPSIARGFYQWAESGEIVSGASTITQQLVRQLAFSYEERQEQSMRRKLKEAALAWVMTRQYSKDDILVLYLNQAYYGNLAYGIEAAADVYFGKHASDLTIGESAFLAGLIQSPAIYDPYTNFAVAKARQRQVLDLMVRHQCITMTAQDADNAFNETPLGVGDLKSPDVSLEAPHFTMAVRQQLGNLPGIDPLLISQGGLEITTTLDMNAQKIGERVVAEQVAANEAEANMHNAALVAINPNTGEVLAMVGSVDYNDKTIDGNVNIVMTLQQPGSSIKPLTYAAALEQGWLPSDILWDVPTDFDMGVGIEPYTPDNYDNRFHGPVRLRDALANSYNIPAVLLLKSVGIPQFLAMADRLGIKSLGMDPSQYGPSLTLGGRDVTPMELTAAYGAFANGGRKVTPTLISKVTDSSGNVLYQAPLTPGEQVLEPRITFMISDILSDNVARTPAMGANSPLLLEFPAAVKTGTTNDYRDNWTIGYTQHLVVGVWAGNTDNAEMAPGTSGLTGAAPIWHDFMQEAYADPTIIANISREDLPPVKSEFAPPPDLEKRPVCILSSLRDPQLAADGCPRTRSEWFPVGGSSISLKPTDVPTPTLPMPTDPNTGQTYPPTRQEVSPGVLAIGVQVLDDTMKQTYYPPPASAGRLTPVTPHYCEVLPQFADLPGLSMQLFITAPRDPDDAIRARNFALNNGIPIDPGVVCPQELIDQVRGGGGFVPGMNATYSIDTPKPNQGVYGVIPVIGTVNYNPDLVEYYRVDIGAGDAPTEWRTIGETHDRIVVHGELEILHADALQPGRYVLRLVLVQVDGNFVDPPYQVSIEVLSSPPTPTANP